MFRDSESLTGLMGDSAQFEALKTEDDAVAQKNTGASGQQITKLDDASEETPALVPLER